MQDEAREYWSAKLSDRRQKRAQMMVAAEVLSAVADDPPTEGGSPAPRQGTSKLDIFAYLENKSKREAASLTTQRALKSKANLDAEFLNSYPGFKA